jgi:hypothetical protein
MSPSPARSAGSALPFRRLKPAQERNNLLQRWPEGQLYPIFPHSNSFVGCKPGPPESEEAAC